MLSVLGMLWVPVDIVIYCAFCIMGSLNVCSGESSTRTLFMRVMETFDDDDDDYTFVPFGLYRSFYDILLSALGAEI